MKHLLTFILLVVSGPLLAGGYYNGGIDAYDPISGIYYRGVHKAPDNRGFLSSKAPGNLVVNINLFDPATGTSTLLFKEPQKDDITVVLFETGFKDGSIEFNGEIPRNYVLNNRAVPKREPKDKLLIGVSNNDTHEVTLLTSNKRGHDLRKLVTVPRLADWHIDVKNAKVRVVHKTSAALRLESFEW